MKYTLVVFILLVFVSCTSEKSHLNPEPPLVPRKVVDNFQVLWVKWVPDKVVINLHVDSNKNLRLQMYDVLGNGLWERPILTLRGDTTLEYGTFSMPEGIYYTRFYDNDSKKMTKFIIEQ